eukprot:1607738-Ditylum_brightwellii.AAC.1
MLLLLSQLKGYNSRQVDYVQAFHQAPFEEEEVFMEIPAEFYHKDSDTQVLPQPDWPPVFTI